MSQMQKPTAPPHSPAYLRGFVRAAVEVWQLCKAEVEVVV